MATQDYSGDIPQHARERLLSMREGVGGRRFFTSDLTVSEFLLVKEAGFDPLGLVVGTSIYHIGIQVARLRTNMEMDVLTQAMYHARELAMQRMAAGNRLRVALAIDLPSRLIIITVYDERN